jgi:hypothetical protein
MSLMIQSTFVPQEPLSSMHVLYPDREAIFTSVIYMRHDSSRYAGHPIDPSDTLLLFIKLPILVHDCPSRCRGHPIDPSDTLLLFIKLPILVHDCPSRCRGHPIDPSDTLLLFIKLPILVHDCPSRCRGHPIDPFRTNLRTKPTSQMRCTLFGPATAGTTPT